jgi:diaminopimelate epimerase
MIPTGRPFYKMSGSGNDFVFVDARKEPPGRLSEPAVVGQICARGTGVGADGIVFLEPSDVAGIRLTYLNADGSPAFCGNATLCTLRLSTELGIGAASGMQIETEAGVVSARIVEGRPEIDLQPVRDVAVQWAEIPLEAGERRVGFAVVGVPHVVVRVDDVEAVDVVERGRAIRRHPSLAHGANANFVSRDAGGRWKIRTYERGVEAETLACGSGTVASAILLSLWGEASGVVSLETRSGRDLTVTLRRDQTGEWRPSLRGHAAVVFEGRLAEI